MVYGADLESLFGGNLIAGSNPVSSAFARRSFSEVGIRFEFNYLYSMIYSYMSGFGGRSPQ